MPDAKSLVVFSIRVSLFILLFSLSDEELISVAEACPTITELNINVKSADTLIYLVSRCQRLSSIVIQGYSFPGVAPINAISRLPDLRELILHMEGNPFTDPGCMKAIGDNCKNLRVLTLNQGLFDRRRLGWAYVLRKIGDRLKSVWICNADYKTVELVRGCRGMESVAFTGTVGVLGSLKEYAEGMDRLSSFRVGWDRVVLF
jgi:hypothetical protein